jgi:hypothetical protein
MPRKKLKVGHRGAKEQITFENPHQSQEAYWKRKGKPKIIISLKESSPATWLDAMVDYKPFVIFIKVVISLSNLTRCSIWHIVK